MRLHIFTGLLSLFILTACNGDKKDLETYEPEATEVNQAEIDGLTKTLMEGGDKGWDAQIRTTSGQVFVFNFKFEADGKVAMHCDCNMDQILAAGNSDYSIGAYDEGTVLNFTSYSYLHQLVDPRPEIMGGDPGKGLGSDIEFKLKSQTNDEILLTGVKNKTTLRLVKAKISFEQQFEKEIEDYKEILKLPSYVNDGIIHLNRTADGSRLYRFRMNAEEGTVQIMTYPANAKGAPTIQSPRTKPENGELLFAAPVYLGGDELGGLRYNKETEMVEYLKNNTWTVVGGVDVSEIVGDMGDGKVYRISRPANSPELDVSNDFLTLLNQVKTGLKDEGFIYRDMRLEFIYKGITIMLTNTEGKYLRMSCDYSSAGDNFQITQVGVDLGDTEGQRSQLNPLADYIRGANFKLKWGHIEGEDRLIPVFYDINNTNFAIYSHL
ncbi:DUF4302 domain-containing protein [Sphingobacterium paucimobilis]|uniref:DUF4302 domain-containing protein n=1 Tax=Sphingobacterium paucimobilis HER1398 TaxID=1346330 RepID=U2HV85_9SPHI|nr:DUF4302 domain-containing protein [Sphingobacterium paucimobilis]ERJ59185.1 hypothetical protein M472_10415 [Sphingobacterium paucimobilis HER1398]